MPSAKAPRNKDAGTAMNANGGQETAMKANPAIAERVTRQRAALMMLIFSVIFGGPHRLPMGATYKSGLEVQAEKRNFFAFP